MEFLAQMWMPIVLSAFAVLVVTSVLCMATPLHKNDLKNPGDKEAAIMSLVRESGLTPGVYFVPWFRGQDRKDPEVKRKMEQGPYAQLTVMPRDPNMGLMMGGWLVHLLVMSALVAYVVAMSGVTQMAAPGMRPQFWPVFRVAGVAGLLAHGGAAVPLSVWHGQPWSLVPGRLVDAVVNAAVTGAIFGAFLS